jgi:hypothetical protein
VPEPSENVYLPKKFFRALQRRVIKHLYGNISPTQSSRIYWAESTAPDDPIGRQPLSCFQNFIVRCLGLIFGRNAVKSLPYCLYTVVASSTTSKLSFNICIFYSPETSTTQSTKPKRHVRAIWCCSKGALGVVIKPVAMNIGAAVNTLASNWTEMDRSKRGQFHLVKKSSPFAGGSLQ